MRRREVINPSNLMPNSRSLAHHLSLGSFVSVSNFSALSWTRAVCVGYIRGPGHRLAQRRTDSSRPAACGAEEWPAATHKEQQHCRQAPAAPPSSLAVSRSLNGEITQTPTRPPALRLTGFRYIPSEHPPNPLAVKGFPEPRLQSNAKRTLQPLPSTNR